MSRPESVPQLMRAEIPFKSGPVHRYRLRTWWLIVVDRQRDTRLVLSVLVQELWGSNANCPLRARAADDVRDLSDTALVFRGHAPEISF